MKKVLVLTYNVAKGHPFGIETCGDLEVEIRKIAKGSPPSSWGDLEVDHLVIYASTGLEYQISGPKRITLVACDCDPKGVVRRLDAQPHRLIRVVFGECGGEKTLGRIVEELLNNNA